MSDRLTLHAEGPATVELRREVDGMDVSERVETTLDVSVQLDEDATTAVIDVHTKGAVMARSDVIEFVVEHLNETGAAPDESYRIDGDQHGEWTVRLTGRVDTWTDVAVGLAIERLGRSSKAKRATLACDILDGLAECVDESGQRPVLAMLDLVEEYNVSGYSRDGLLDRLASDDVVNDVAVDQEASA